MSSLFCCFAAPTPLSTMSSAVPSAREFAKRLTAVAYGAAGKEPPREPKTAGVPLVPIFVGIDRGPEQGANRGEQEQLREVRAVNAVSLI